MRPFLPLLRLFILWCILCWPLPGSARATLAELDAQLELLLPGAGLQEQSARAYAKQQLATLFAQLEKHKIDKKKPHQALALLRSEVEGTFLLSYTPYAEINLLFKRGQYDQATATALYALVFQHLEMPYALQVQGSEIVLVADLEDNNQVVRIPGTGGRQTERDQIFQQLYLDLLRNLNFIPQNEWSRPPEEVFHTYYLGNDDQLTLAELADFLYYRQALSAYNDKAWTLALGLLAKTNPSASRPVYAVLERAIWLQIANTGDNSPGTMAYLWKLWQASPGDPWQGELLRRFSTITSTLPKPGKWAIDSVYGVFNDRFARSPAAQLQLREMYFLQQARCQAKLGNSQLVMDFMDSLYLLRPHDTGIHNVLGGMLVWSLRAKREFGPGLESIQFYESRYPFLRSNLLFQDQHLFYLAERVRALLDSEDEAPGMAAFQDFKDLARRTGRTPRYDSCITTSYLAVSNFYFRKGNYSQALATMADALRAAPGDSYLAHRVEVLRRYLR